jgi:hypothetical protein
MYALTVTGLVVVFDSIRLDTATVPEAIAEIAVEPVVATFFIAYEVFE